MSPKNTGRGSRSSATLAPGPKKGSGNFSNPRQTPSLTGLVIVGIVVFDVLVIALLLYIITT